MITLNVIRRGGPPLFNHRTETLCLNPTSIVSIAPANHNRTIIKEVNGSPSDSFDISEVEYTVGSRAEKILVVGSYEEILRETRSSRRLLNG